MILYIEIDSKKNCPHVTVTCLLDLGWRSVLVQMLVDGGPKSLLSAFFIPASLTMEVFWIYSQISSQGRSSLL